jgi:hypothetical protein
MNLRRWLLVSAVLLTAAGLGVWLYDPITRGWVPGVYTAPSLDKERTITLRLAADGTALCESCPTGSVTPTRLKSGRWRLAGRMLILEFESAASVPVGVFQPLWERYDAPLETPEIMRWRLVSADSRGLVLDLGDVHWVARRVTGESQPATPDLPMPQEEKAGGSD